MPSTLLTERPTTPDDIADEPLSWSRLAAAFRARASARAGSQEDDLLRFADLLDAIAALDKR